VNDQIGCVLGRKRESEHQAYEEALLFEVEGIVGVAHGSNELGDVSTLQGGERSKAPRSRRDVEAGGVEGAEVLLEPVGHRAFPKQRKEKPRDESHLALASIPVRIRRGEEEISNRPYDVLIGRRRHGAWPEPSEAIGVRS
jgi:hypothetical protein